MFGLKFCVLNTSTAGTELCGVRENRSLGLGPGGRRLCRGAWAGLSHDASRAVALSLGLGGEGSRARSYGASPPREGEGGSPSVVLPLCGFGLSSPRRRPRPQPRRPERRPGRPPSLRGSIPHRRRHVKTSGGKMAGPEGGDASIGSVST